MYAAPPIIESEVFAHVPERLRAGANMRRRGDRAERERMGER
jgi:hypothetical protein